MHLQDKSILTTSGLPDGASSATELTFHNAEDPSGGLLIINADDWGRDRDTTQQIRECALRGTVSSVSAMVFMEDSERAAGLARERGIDAGVHLNFSTSFTAPNCPAQLAEHQHNLATYLLRHPLARLVFHPGLVRSFEYVVAAQIDEFRRLYGVQPRRFDGHHHLHLCANVLFAGLLPAGTVARRNFTFRRGEKSLLNRAYREGMDRVLGRNHLLVDFLCPLAPLEPVDRLRRIVSLARQHVVEVETHPINPQEFGFLMGGQIFDLVQDCPIAPDFGVAHVQRVSEGVSNRAKARA